MEFIDSVVEQYAYKNWDTNSDNCIDKEEAEKVKELPQKAFLSTNVATLEDLNSFPNLITIGDNAFENCTELEVVDLDYVQAVGKSAFLNSGVKKVTMKSALEIGVDAFYNLETLEQVNLPKVTSINMGAFTGCTNLSSLEIPEVTYIGRDAFVYNYKLTSVEVPNLETIEMYAFSSSGLKQISLPKLKTLPFRAFEGCGELTRIELPAVNYIEKEALFGCEKLTDIVLTTPDNIRFENYSCFISYYYNNPTDNTTLTLNKNKQAGGSSAPLVSEDGTWVGYQWKEIKFVESVE